MSVVNQSQSACCIDYQASWREEGEAYLGPSIRTQYLNDSKLSQFHLSQLIACFLRPNARMTVRLRSIERVGLGPCSDLLSKILKCRSHGHRRRTPGRPITLPSFMTKACITSRAFRTFSTLDCIIKQLLEGWMDAWFGLVSNQDQIVRRVHCRLQLLVISARSCLIIISPYFGAIAW